MAFDKVSCDFLQGLLNNKDRAYAQNNGFLDRAQLLMQNLLNQDYRAPMLKL
jgi:hypothetical protein